MDKVSQKTAILLLSVVVGCGALGYGIGYAYLKKSHNNVTKESGSSNRIDSVAGKPLSGAPTQTRQAIEEAAKAGQTEYQYTTDQLPLPVSRQ